MQKPNRTLLSLNVFLQLIFIDYLVCFKNPAFAEEKEWRFVYYDFHNKLDYIQFRIAGKEDTIIPYVELNSVIFKNDNPDLLPISRITYGQTPHNQLTKNSLELLLKKFNYQDVGVEESSVPIRSSLA